MIKLTPLRAIRKYCLWCCGDSAPEVKLCSWKVCQFYNHRLGKGGGRLLRLIKVECYNCSGFKYLEQKNCCYDGIQEHECFLHPYRLGKRPIAPSSVRSLANRSRKGLQAMALYHKKKKEGKKK